MTEDSLYVFGDSHSLIFQGRDTLELTECVFPRVRVRHLGPCLAFHSNGKSYDEIAEVLKSAGDVGAVLLSFGEIDIRTQILKRVDLNHTTPEHETRSVVQVLMATARRLYETFKKPVIIFEPIPTIGWWADACAPNADFPIYGSEYDRNYATYLFSKYVRDSIALLDKKGEEAPEIYSFGIYRQIAPRFMSRYKFFRSDNHLNLRGFGLVLHAFRVMCLANGVDFYKFFRIEPA